MGFRKTGDADPASGPPRTWVALGVVGLGVTPRTSLPVPWSFIALAAALVLAAATGCQGDDGGLGDRLEMLPLRVGVPAGLNPAFSHNFTIDAEVPTDHERFARETGVAWEDWERVEPRRASLVITEAGLDWSFAREVVLKGYRDDPAAQVELFYRDPIPTNVGQRLDMIPSDRDVKGLLDGDTYGLILEIRRLRNAPPQSFPVTLEYSYRGVRG